MTDLQALEGVLSRRGLLKAMGLGAGAAALAPVLAACGGGETGSAATEVVEWNGWTGADGVDNLKDFLAKFPAAKENMKVKNVAYQWDTLFSKLPVAVQSGNAPNVVIMHPTEVPQFVDLKILQPLDDLLGKAGISFTDIEPNAVEVNKFQGKQYGVPGDFHPMGMYYNIKHLESAGLDPQKPPANAEEFLHFAEELKGKVPSSQMLAPLFIPYNNAAQARWFWWSLLHQFGGTFLSEDNTTCTVDSEAGVKSLQFLVDLFKKGLATGDGGSQSPESAGKIGMWMVGPWAIPQYLGAKLPFVTGELPVIGTKPATWANGHCFVVVQGTSGKALDNSMKFIKWFQENYADPAQSQGLVPVSKKALADPIYTGSRAYPHLQPFIKASGYAVLEPRMHGYTNVFTFGKPTPLSVNLTAALQGKLPVAEALKEMASGVNAILAKN